MSFSFSVVGGTLLILRAADLWKLGQGKLQAWTAIDANMIKVLGRRTLWVDLPRQRSQRDIILARTTQGEIIVVAPVGSDVRTGWIERSTAKREGIKELGDEGREVFSYVKDIKSHLIGQMALSFVFLLLALFVGYAFVTGYLQFRIART